ncbi:MAG: hypothetical protein HZB51_33055 [Chloroflexi bacterium]|nr:hypothetical protein [Chloroflexota bacterium]
MKTLNERQLQVHVPIAAWLLIATNGLNALVYLLTIALSLGAPAYLLAGALAFPTAMVLAAIPGLIAGLGLRAHKAWARFLGIVGVVVQMAGLAVAFLRDDLALPVLVVCAFVGIYTILVLMQNATANYLASPKQRLETAPRHA